MPGPPPNSFPTRTAISGDSGFFSSIMSWRCCLEMPSRRAISIFFLPEAGSISSRRTAPGCVGHRLGFRLATYSVISSPFGVGHNGSRASVVLFVVHAISISILEFEGDAPWPIHMNRIPNRLSVQTMKIEAEQVHVVRTHRSVELVETSQNAIMHLCIDLRSLAARPEIAWRLVFERLDHKATRVEGSSSLT